MTAAVSERSLATNFYPAISWPHEISFAKCGARPSGNFVARLCSSYRLQCSAFDGHGASIWEAINAKNAEVHEALLAGQETLVADFVENPTKTNIFFGFESAVKESIDNFLRNPRSLDEEVGSICDRLLRLAEAVGAVRLYYPEAMLQRRDSLDCESLLDSISSEIGYQVRFPNPYPNEFGLQTSRGIASYRAIQAIYQAWRLRQLTEVYGHGIIEIGGGLGRTACYSRLMQVTNDYTIVDLPLSIVAQAIFLSKIFGEEIVCLPGEKHIPGSIRLETPNWYLEQRPWAAIVMNVDSLPEMDIVQAEKYASVSAANSSVVLSINHEFNAFKVSDLRAYKDVPRSRHPYWVRKGYVEEFFLTGKRASTVQRHGFLSRIASAMIGTPTS